MAGSYGGDKGEQMKKVIIPIILLLVVVGGFSWFKWRPKDTLDSPTPTPSVTLTPTTEVQDDESEEISTPIVYPTVTPTVPQSVNNSVSPASTPTAIPTVVQPINNTAAPATKADYSSYKLALLTTLSSLQARLASIHSQADNILQEVDNAIASLDNAILDLEARKTNEVNQATKIVAQEMANRGITAGSEYYQQQIQAVQDSILSYYDPMIAQLNNERSQIFADAENRIYQYAAQDEDLSNKISVVQGLINKITSGNFSDSDIPITLQAMNY